MSRSLSLLLPPVVRTAILNFPLFQIRLIVGEYEQAGRTVDCSHYVLLYHLVEFACDRMEGSMDREVEGSLLVHFKLMGSSVRF